MQDREKTKTQLIEQIKFLRRRITELEQSQSERKKTEEELHDSEMLFHTTVTSLPLIVFVLNQKGIFTLSEGRGLEVLGVLPEKVLSKPVDEVFADKPKILEDIQRTFDGKSTKSIIEIGEVTLQIQCSPIFDSDGKIEGIIGVAIDISERKQAEEELKTAYTELKETQIQLIQAEKFSAVGQLASGVAHEVKTPLGILIQDINYLEKNLPPKKDITGVLNMMKNNIKRADDIVRALVDFSRLAELKIKPEDINSIIKSSLALVQHKIKLENIKFMKLLEKDLPKVLVDKGKIEQVFLNLFLNAIEAMPKGGELYIRSYLTQLSKAKNGIGRRSADYFKLAEKVVIIEIEDTGTGISQQNLKRVFDAFFTTKGVGKGIVLGLAVTWNIIEMHRGLIEIKSEEGKGTKVIIALKISGGR